jgi:hypothetical protein
MTWVFKVLCPVLIKNLLIIYTFELLHVVLLMLRDTLFHLPTNVQSTSALKHFYESRGAGSTPSRASSRTPSFFSLLIEILLAVSRFNVFKHSSFNVPEAINLSNLLFDNANN